MVVETTTIFFGELGSVRYSPGCLEKSPGINTACASPNAEGFALSVTDFSGNRYHASVPKRMMGRTVEVRIDGKVTAR
jgi:hypothetical protein